MYNLKLLILCCLFYFQNFTGNAQNKYALVIGINEYYSQPNIKSEYSLKGCVNDALSIKALLTNRFAFDPKNINTLINQAATQKNLIDAFNNIIAKSKAGDAVVFYFSGHGTFIDNSAINNDPVKRGYNQALVMSNLFAKDYDCLVRDNTLKKLFNQLVAKKVILTSIFDCCFSGGMAAFPMPVFGIQENPYSDDIKEYAYHDFTDTLNLKSFPAAALDTSGRAFNMESTLFRRDTELVPRPAETPNSKFASLAASEDNVRAAEIWDESGVPHGAFTRALLCIYGQHNTDLSLSEIIKKVDAQVTTTQLFNQKPQYAFDPARKQVNLIGLPVKTSTSIQISASCINIKGNLLTINNGYHNGLAIGNTLTNKKGKIIITRIYADSAIAKSFTNQAFAIGDNFVGADNYRTSNPLIKIFIATANTDVNAFLKSFNSEILPITKRPTYLDYYNWSNKPALPTYLFAIKPGEGKRLLSKAKDRKLCILLPIPSDLASEIKKMLAKEQSVKIVNAANEADKVLYLNYAVKSKNNVKARFVFNYRSALGDQDFDIYKFSRFATSIDNLVMPDHKKMELAEKIKKITYELIRSRGTHWINTYAKN
ncbi:MAG: caspase family protein [Pedobacter sp.]|nr:MAG: caspase family protein [Pedobacter sp.]